jgi:glutathione synthase/RimK-type ligase-like ATP-grasp enzyme
LHVGKNNFEMATTKIAAIMRAGVYSPNHIGNDATILNTVAEQLRKRGCEVRIYSEEQFCSGEVSEPVIINMCRERRSTDLLQSLEDQGQLVINSGYGIENCIRERQARILLGSNIPYPQSLIVDTDEVIKTRLQKLGFTQCWIKRGDFHAQHAEDVSYVRTPAEAQDVLQEYFLRGFKRAVISRHLVGRLVKFYGVAGTNFFQWFRPYEAEALNMRDEETRRTDEALKALCAKAAKELNLIVYGGECIQAADGSLSIIDFNDWPSFSPCRAEAATAIAKAVMAAIKNHQ